MLKWLLIVFLGTSGSPAFADYLSGKEAYDNGDFQKAFGNWITSAENGNPASQNGIGVMYDNGDGVPEDNAEAVKWFRLAAEQGDAKGQINLGTMYEYGEGVSEDKVEAVKWYRLGAKQGDTNGQAYLGKMYDYGEGVTEDNAKAFKWYKLAAEGGNTDVQNNIGFMHDNGEGVPEDKVEAVKWYRLAAELGNAKGQVNLGWKYEHGEGVPKDKIKAANWYRLAAEQGDANGQFNLGTIYDYGKGLLEDNAEAFKWYMLAAEQGNTDGQNNIGFMYDHGEGVPEDKAEAEKWYQLAAERGDVDAVFNLAKLYYFQGRYVEAEPLYKQAIVHGEKSYGLNDPKLAANLTDLALLYHDQGRNSEAEPLYRRSLIINEKFYGSNHPNISVSLNNLASLYHDQGRYVEAEPLYKQAIIIEENFDYSNHSGALLNLANLYNDQERYAEAQLLYKSYLTITEKALEPHHPDIAMVLNNLANLYAKQERYVDAEQLFKRAIDIYNKAFGPNHPDTATKLGNLAVMYMEQGRYKDAEPLYKKALLNKEKALGSEHPNVALTLNGLATLYKEQGHLAKAKPIYERALSIFENTFNSYHPRIALTLNFLASLSNSLSEKQESLDYIRRAVAISKSRVIANTGLESGYFNEQKLNRGVFISHVKQTLEMQEPINRKVLISEAFESGQLAITAKASAAIENMASRFATADDKITILVRGRQDAAAQWWELDKALVKAISQLPEERNKIAEAVLTKSLKQTTDLLEALDRQLETSFPKFAELSSGKPVKLTDTQSLLSPSEALFTFISEEETEATYAFLVRKDDARAYKIDLSEDQLGEMVAALRSDIDLLGVENIAALPEFDLDLAHDLYSKLLGPAADMLEDVEHLLVVPTGPMESLPFNLLVTEPPSAEGSDFKRYQSAAWLPKRFSVTRLPSVSSLRALRVFATNSQATEPFKGFGDPVLNGVPGEVRGLKIIDVYEGVQANTDKVRGLPELPETSGELRLIAKYLNSSEDNLYLRERATETELKSADLSNSRVLGFATHGLVGGELNGLAEPALVLTPPAAGSDLDDGLLKASEVAQLKLNADMVLLSACNTASGENLGAEGLSGLARAFIYAGARSLLVSHWSVDSGSAAELTTGLFEALDANPEMGRAEALQSSMMSLASDSENPHYSHPAFWAPFSLIGEGAALN